MSAKPNGGPAFPRPAGKNGYPQLGYEDGNRGMTLRQWYAGMALQGFCANLGCNETPLIILLQCVSINPMP